MRSHPPIAFSYLRLMAAGEDKISFPRVWLLLDCPCFHGWPCTYRVIQTKPKEDIELIGACDGDVWEGLDVLSEEWV